MLPAEKLMAKAILCAPPYLRRQGLSLKLDFSSLVRLISQQTPQIPMSRPPSIPCWGDRWVLLYPAFYMGAGETKSALHTWVAVTWSTEPFPSPSYLKCLNHEISLKGPHLNKQRGRKEREFRTVKASGCAEIPQDKHEQSVSPLGFSVGFVLVQALAHA